MRWSRKERERRDAEMNEEFRFHLEQRAADLERGGLSPEEARRRARVEFGSINQHQESARDIWFSRVLRDVVADARFGMRVLLRAPAFSITAVLTLALGIGVTAAVFSLVYGVLYRPLPFPNAERIAMVYVHFSPQNNPRGTMSLADFADWRAQNTSFEKVAAYTTTRFIVGGEGASEQVAGASVTADFFAVLGTKPLLGRTFLPGEDSAAAAKSVVLSESLWRRRFAADREVVGRVIQVDGESATILGVVAGSRGVPSGNVELWQNQKVAPTRRGPFLYRGIGLLRPGVSIQTAQAETNAIAGRVQHAFPHSYTNLSMPIEPLRNALTYNVRPALLVIFASVVVVLLIAAVNIANLLLARASAREHEMAVRISLGASRTRLVRQLLTESVLLALLGAAAGVVLAYWSIQTFKAANIAGIPLTYQVTLDRDVLAFTFLLSLATGVLFGLVPALQTARPDVSDPLKAGQRTSSATRSTEFRRAALVVTEVALSLMLLVGAGLLFRSLLRLQQVDAGFTAPAHDVLTMEVSPSPISGQAPASPQAMQLRLAQFYRAVLERVRQLPEVASVAVSDSLPPDLEGEDDTFMIEGEPWNDRDYPSTTAAKVSPDYFRALGVPLLRGRVFTPADTEKSAPVALISESLARRYFHGGDPIGRRMRQSGPGGEPVMEIVGVVGDVKYWGLNADNDAAYYQVYTQNSAPSMYLVIHSANAAALPREVEQAIHELDKGAAVRAALTLDEVVDQSLAQPRFRATLLVGFAALALLLAAIGIYGVIAYSVSQRTRDLGIRLALGAPRSAILALVVRHGALLTAAGLLLGFAGSVLAARLVASFLFGVPPYDPVTLAGGSLLLALVALSATCIPALRATRIDPVEALRTE